MSLLVDSPALARLKHDLTDLWCHEVANLLLLWHRAAAFRCFFRNGFFRTPPCEMYDNTNVERGVEAAHHQPHGLVFDTRL